jgi:hypothetical protein
MTFAKRPLRQRIMALVAAYAIALAGVVASFGAAQSAAQSVDRQGGIICHSDLATGPGTGSHDSNGDICLKTCVGCITSLAMAIPPTVSADRIPQSAVTRPDLQARVVRIAGAKFNAHRSRGPPPVL